MARGKSFRSTRIIFAAFFFCLAKEFLFIANQRSSKPHHDRYRFGGITLLRTFPPAPQSPHPHLSSNHAFRRYNRKPRAASHDEGSRERRTCRVLQKFLRIHPCKYNAWAYPYKFIAAFLLYFSIFWPSNNIEGQEWFVLLEIRLKLFIMIRYEQTQ